MKIKKSGTTLQFTGNGLTKYYNGYTFPEAMEDFLITLIKQQ